MASNANPAGCDGGVAAKSDAGASQFAVHNQSASSLQDYPQTPGFKATGTSEEAARRIAPAAKNLRANVLALLIDAAPASLSADEIAVRLSRSILSVRPRVSELAAAGKIRRADGRARNASGMSAATWRAAE